LDAKLCDRAAEGCVRITTAESLARAFLAPRLAGFRRTHPGIELSVKTDNRVLSLTRREADLALRHWRPTQPGLVARKIARVSFAFYASPAYVAEGRLEADDVFLGFEDELATMPDAEWLAERRASGYATRTNSRGVLERVARRRDGTVRASPVRCTGSSRASWSTKLPK
jgi:DNA-binding transcriptional LysR family regulator